ncbi:cytochrome C oxidase subunit IV family protein [Acidimicrobium ferrooxidans]|nr:cytochrome C oxidase subunit IV family protein [Acidimicrobium ferrooxidans]
MASPAQTVTAAPAQAVDGHGHGHEDQENATYWKVLGALAVLTIAEVGLLQLPLSKLYLGLLLVPMSWAKIVLIIGFFMHLKFDSRLLWIVVASPACLSALLFITPLLDTITKP